MYAYGPKRMHRHDAGGNSSPGAIAAQQACIQKTETEANEELANSGVLENQLRIQQALIALERRDRRSKINPGGG
jgi:hypothetical protein